MSPRREADGDGGGSIDREEFAELHKTLKAKGYQLDSLDAVLKVRRRYTPY